jgi:hypothetical protein
MNWLRDALKALGWAVAATALCVGVLLSAAIGGWEVYAVTLAVAPPLASSFHRSGRVAAMTAGWELLIVGGLVGLVDWLAGDGLAGFRAPGR